MRAVKNSYWKQEWKNVRRYKDLLAMFTIVIAYFVIFKYIPMYGVTLAFKDFRLKLGILRSPWAGLKHFRLLFSTPSFFEVLRNTVSISLLRIVFGFPAPILLALLLNELRYPRFKRVVQTISYMPYFLSVVIVVGMMKELFNMSNGPVNELLAALGLERQNFFMMPSAFRPLYIGSGVWQGIGYSSIIYLAAIAGINPEMYESAVLDGAGRVKQMWYITLPSILPTISILFILAVAGILGNDYQKILLMYSPRTYSTADVVNTYVYRYGIETAGNHLSYSSSVGLLVNVVSLVFLIIANTVTGRLSETSLF